MIGRDKYQQTDWICIIIFGIRQMIMIIMYSLKSGYPNMGDIQLVYGVLIGLLL